jgi:hypothetical protein
MMSEYDNQSAFFAYLRKHEGRDPRLKWGVFAVPNGAWYGRANRYGVGMKQKAQGLKAGVWDVCCTIPSVIQVPNHKLMHQVYHGAWFEFKFGKNKLTEKQKAFGEFVEAQGYATFIPYSWIEAVNDLGGYLGHEWMRVDE